jgi:hypothetical protein
MFRRVLPLLLLVAACSQPAPVTRPSPQIAQASTERALPPIPASVVSQLGPVPIVWKDSLADGQGNMMMGGFQFIERRIYLSTEVRDQPIVAWQTLLHEECHVALWDSGLQNAIPLMLAQQLCDAFASFQVAEMLSRLR